MASLEEVIAFYNGGGRQHPNKDTRIRALGLSEQEQSDLIAFLTTLTDWNFVQNKDLLPLMQ
jgi:cytochrome c peroxidase